jgi:uncharacterized BrkB/YihY/UPF0761 family membrane protein
VKETAVEIDHMMEVLGFNEQAMKSYMSAVPYVSRKQNIMNQIYRLNHKVDQNQNFFALFYILSIAFLVLMVRFIVLTQIGDSTGIAIFASILIRYSNQLQWSFNALSLLVSVLICVGIGFATFYLKNEKRFC